MSKANGDKGENRSAAMLVSKEKNRSDAMLASKEKNRSDAMLASKEKGCALLLCDAMCFVDAYDSPLNIGTSVAV